MFKECKNYENLEKLFQKLYFSKAPALDVVLKIVKEFPECEIVIWMPVVEKDFGQDRFFTEEPSELFRKGNFNQVPVIAGRTADEFVSPVPGKKKTKIC